ncbi:MAG: glycosyltransferase family 2 protein [Verrucomicrobia bacterium]|nr:glycosyltransferase family 2 protein [Verrucomicrobiota bacterium]
MVPLPISVCMVSGAEAHRIGPALASVAGWTRELIVVLNAETQDGTERLVRERGGQVFREPWKGFIGQKNSAAAKATQPWVLNLDADEVVSGPLQAQMAALFAGSGRGPRHAAYEFPRCTFYCGRWIRHGDWYPDRVLRLWQRGRAHWTGQEPHARLEVQGSVGRLGADLLHYSNETIARHLAKIVPYQEGFVAARLARAGTPGLLTLAGRPAWKFLRGYVLRAGFLDGWQGLFIAAVNSFSTLTRYAMVREARVAQATSQAAVADPGDSESPPARGADGQGRRGTR